MVTKEGPKKVKKSTGDMKKEYEDRIKALESRIASLEKSGPPHREPEEAAMVSSVMGQLIPGLGGIVRTLEKTSPEFRKRIAETDAEIKHRIETGWSSKPSVEGGFTVKSMSRGPIGVRPGKSVAKPVERRITAPSKVPEREPIIDIFEEKDHISVIAEIPGIEEKDIKVVMDENRLVLTAGKHSKVIELPKSAHKIKDQTFKNGILHINVKRK